MVNLRKVAAVSGFLVMYLSSYWAWYWSNFRKTLFSCHIGWKYSVLTKLLELSACILTIWCPWMRIITVSSLGNWNWLPSQQLCLFEKYRKWVLLAAFILGSLLSIVRANTFHKLSSYIITEKLHEPSYLINMICRNRYYLWPSFCATAKPRVYSTC